MFVIAHHFIQEPEAFWALAPHIKLHSVFPSKELKTGTCVWEANNVVEVEKLVDSVLGKLSRNVCYEVNEEVAISLPQQSMEATAS